MSKDSKVLVSRELLSETIEMLIGSKEGNPDQNLEKLRIQINAPADCVPITAVATLHDDGDGGLEPYWLLEGGTAELWAGATLLVAPEHPNLCTEDGHAELYASADEV